MTETFTLSPTAYDQARDKQNRMTPKQRRREGYKQLKIALGRLNQKNAPAVNHEALKLAWRICQTYGLDEPVIIQCLLPLYEAMAPIEL